MKLKPNNLILAALIGATLAAPAVAQTATSPSPSSNIGSTNPPAGALITPPGLSTNPSTGAPMQPSEAGKARSDAAARSRVDSEIRANQIRREAEEATTRSRGSAALPQSGTPAGSVGAGTGPLPGSAISGGSSGLDRATGTYPGNPSAAPIGSGTRPGG